MATKSFEGNQDNVKQIDTAQVTAFDAATTYVLTIGAGTRLLAISVLGDTDVNTTATALKDAWNASTHPYASHITATVATDTVTLTADVPGCPFIVVSSKIGGTGTIGAIVVATANKSSSDVNDAANYDTNSLPVSSDTIIHAVGAPAMAWNLESLSSLTSVVLDHPRGAGNIGLRQQGFAITSDGQTTDPDAPEYRDTYLKMDFATINIGGETGPTNVAGATRIKVNNTRSSASATTIFSVAGASMDPGLPTVRLLFAHSGADIDVQGAFGGWGVAVDNIGETSTIGDVDIQDVSGTAKSFLGPGVTWTSFIQQSGESEVYGVGGGGTETIKVRGGTCNVNGAFGSGPILIINSGATLKWSCSSANIGTMTIEGTFDATTALAQPDIGNFSPSPGAVLKAGQLGIKIDEATLTEPDGIYTMTWSQ